MPIANYQNPGVYVTQATNPAAAVNVTNNLNVCYIASVSGLTAPTATNTDRGNITAVIGTITLTMSGALSAGLQVTNSRTGAVLSGTTGAGWGNQAVDYLINTNGGSVTSITISGAYSTTNPLAASVSYDYYTAIPGQFYTFYSYDQAQRTFGNPFSYASSTSTASINSPASLAAYLAFQNGAKVVTCVNLPNNGNTPQDFMNTIISGVGSTPGIDVIVPLKYDGTTGPTGLFPQLNNFLNAQAANGIYQRAFVGLDSTVSNANLINTCNDITNTLSSTRMSLTAPQTITLNPGINSQSGLSTGLIDVPGYYIAAATAGLFAGQIDVYVPITRKTVQGFVSIPNQISTSDSDTLQAFGTVVVRQRKDASIYVRHGLTTNTTNWITQEISINAIGDRLAHNLSNTLEASNLIGSPLTQTTMVTLQSIVHGTLLASVNSNLIQSFQNLTFNVDPVNPTTVNVTFQYAPTVPLNYIQVVFSLNSQSGQIQFTGTGI